MKSTKTFGLAALIALVVMAFAGVSSAMAGTTALCGSDQATCASPVTHVHKATKVKMKLKSSVLDVECDVLFLSTSVGGLASPQIIKGSFTYTNCGNCTVSEENGPAKFEALRTDHETAYAPLTWLIHVTCKSFLDCRYDGVGLEAVISGPLLSFVYTNGQTSILAQILHKESGFLCPASTELYIVTVPLSATYISQ